MRKAKQPHRKVIFFVSASALSLMLSTFTNWRNGFEGSRKLFRSVSRISWDSHLRVNNLA
jgi:hypothetical protein